MKYTGYNIYYGTIGKTLGVKYRITKTFKDEETALQYAKKEVFSFYLKNEGKFGIPNYNQIIQESKLTGVPIKQLYEDHIEDLCRFYVIPLELDTIPIKKLKW